MKKFAVLLMLVCLVTALCACPNGRTDDLDTITVVDHDGNTVSFADLLGTPPDQVEEEVRRRITLSKVQRALPTLPERERTVLMLRYGLKDGVVHPQHEIADLLGISRSYVSRVEKHGIELLRERLTETQ